MRLKNNFLKIFIVALLLGVASFANAQTVKTVGATGADYSTLKGAFDAINAGTLTGSITLQVIANTTETTSAVLNATATGTANYAAVNIYPTVSGLTITGNIAGPMIKLNGASNVTIDGSVNGLGAVTDMVISNTSTSTSTTVNTSTILLYGDATYNTIKYSNIQGSANATSNNGIIMFLGVGTGTGNNNNTISNNNISSAGSTRAGVAIYAFGVAGDLLTNNTITNNNIFNFISTTKNSYAIQLDAYTSAWTISNNSIYETASFLPTSTSSYYLIYVNSSTMGSNFTISGNYLGGGAPNAGGSAMTKTGNTNTFIGIYFNALNGATASNIQGNTITNMNITNTSSNAAYGMYINSGSVNIGTTTGNTIGAASGNGAISYTGTYATSGIAFHGISIVSVVSSISPINIKNNIIGSITASSSTGGVSVIGINQNCTACASNVSNNIIGSTTSVNSITASVTTTTYGSDVIGINFGSSSYGNNTISSNVIANLTNVFPGNLTNVLNGIQVNSSTIAGTTSITSNTIRDLTANNINSSTTYLSALTGINIVNGLLVNVNDNKIYNLSNTNTAFNGALNGIYMNSSSTSAHQFKNNFIYGLSVNASASSAKVIGFNSVLGNNTLVNNVISITANIPSTVYGIYDQCTSTSANNYYFNTIYLSGQFTTGTNNSYAYFGNNGAYARNISNNIFYNGKTNSGSATGKNYGIYLNYASSTGVNMSSNDYYAVTAAGGVMAGTTANSTITQLPILNNNDAGSYNLDPLFSIGSGLNATNYIPSATQLSGNNNAIGILTDYNGVARNATNTSIGAFDYSVVGNVSIISTAGTSSLTYSSLKSAFDAINAGIHQGAITIKLNGGTNESVSAVLNASGTLGSTGTYTGTSSYTSINIYPTVSGVVIAGNLSVPLIDLNGADNVVIDGRVNATGSTKNLTIVNFSTSSAATASTIRWINDASYNTLKYAIIKGAVLGNTSNANGLLFFASGTTTGNINNTITNNDITGLSATIRPTFLITSRSTTTNVFNLNNKITDNSLFDFLNPTYYSYGIYLYSNSDYFTLTGNSFFETTNLTSTSTVTYGFIYLNSLVTNTKIENNYFGGSAPNAQGMFTKSGVNNVFYGIYLYSTNPANGSLGLSIQNNTFKNINYTNSSAVNFYAFYVSTANEVNISNNVIGSSTSNDVITFKNGATGGNFYGMYLVTGTGFSKVENNTIAGIKVDNSDATRATNFYGIFTNSQGTLNVTNNIVGSATISNSIVTNSQATAATGQVLEGIHIAYGSTSTTNAIGNTICNLTNNAQGGVVTKTDQVNGIYVGGSNNFVSGNTIYNLSTSSINNTNSTAADNTSAITGIAEYCNGCLLHDINKNIIYNLSATNPQFTGFVNGIKSFLYYQSGTSRFNSNFIYNLKLNPSSVGANVYGINLVSAYNTYTYNNIITIGEDIPATYYGIAISSNVNGYKYEFYNTINIKGSPAAGNYNSYAFYDDNNITSYTHLVKNNIFVNNRSNTLTATGKNYAAYYNYDLIANSFLSQDYNNYYVSGTNGVLAGTYSGTLREVTQLPIFPLAYDATSVSVDPLFANSLGTTPASFIPNVNSLTAANITNSNTNLKTNDSYSSDYTGKSRNVNSTSMGAYDVASISKITLNATAGNLNNTYNTLYDAFAAINAGTHQGTINIYINSNVIETNTAILRASGYLNALYSSISILPKAPNLTISGNIAGPLIDLYGAKGVIFDGRVNGTGTLTNTCLVVSNTSTSTSASTFRLAADAANNIIRYNTIKGSGAGPGTSVIYFWYTGSSKGITNNIIDHNNITSVSDNARPYYTIYSNSYSTTPITFTTISNNNFYNFLNPDFASNGIYLNDYNDNWTIKGNSFYETTNFAPTTGSPYTVIYINSISSKSNFTITGNYIGGSAPNAGGTPWTKLGSNDNIFQAIYLNTSSAGVQGNLHSNTITNFDYSNSAAASFTGIYVYGGSYNIGSKGANIIGATSGNNAIIYKAGANNGNFYGMFFSSTNAINCQNNTIGSIKTDNSNTAYATHFYGIYRTGGNLNLINNTVGSKDPSTTNSIDLASISSASGQSAYGIYINSSTNNQTTVTNNTIAKIRNQNNQATSSTGVVNGINLSTSSTSYAISGLIANNTIYDLSIANSNTNINTTAAVIGINDNNYQVAGTLVTQSFNNNTIYNLKNTSDNFSGNIIGMFLSGSSSKNIVNANFIYGLSATGANSVAANLYGVKIDKGSFRLANNILSLGGNTKTNLYGLYIGTGSSMDSYIYYNTIQISGSVSSGTNISNAIYIADKTSIRDIRNNIFNNTRSTTGGANLHFAYYMPSITGSLSFTSNYNNFIASGVGGTLGYYNGINKTITNITGVDANSSAIDPGFGSDLTLKSSFVTTASLPATSLTDITFDFNENTRNAISPLMGALESSSISNTVSVYNGPSLQASYPNLKLAFDAINAGTHSGTITLKLTDNETLYNSAILNESGIGGANYTSINIYPTIDGIKISGNIPMPLIYLNGADNVTIDGRVNGVGSNKSLEISNLNQVVDYGNSTIKIENDASYFTLQYCTLKGATTSNKDGIFTIGNTASTGNDQILIANNNFTNAYNDITKSSANSIYIQTSVSGYENDHITIDNNLFYDNINTFNSLVTPYVINVQSYNSYVTISNNSIYKTSNTLSTYGSTIYAIYLNNTVASSILSNNIGGSASQAGGLPFVLDATLSDNNFFGIYLNNSSATTHEVQGNVITNIDFRHASAFTGIYLGGNGAINLGDKISNVIGARTGNNAILFKGIISTNTFIGIQNYNTGNVLIKNNAIGSITTSSTLATYATNIYGIYVTATTANKLKIANNIIGSTDGITTNSLAATSSSTSFAQSVRGIYAATTTPIQLYSNIISKLYNAATGSVGHTVQGISLSGSATVIDNTISDLISNSDLNTDATITPVVVGILQAAGSTSYNSTIQGNKVYNLFNTGASSAAVNLNGIYFNGLSSGSNLISNNYIYNIVPNTNSTASVITGIKIVGGTTTYANNIINLGGDIKSNITGIYETGAVGNDNKFYYNTINLSGNIASGTNSSSALYSAVNTNVKEFKNNILVNSRSTTGGSNMHYALYVASGTNTITSDYNNYYVSGTGSVLGFYGANVNTSTIVTGNDVHSVSTNPNFSSGNSNTAFNFYPSSSIIADPTTSITTDYLNRVRSNAIPVVGALEYNTNTNTVDVYAANVLQASYPLLNNAFDAINAGTHTGTIDVKINASTILTSSAILNASGTGNANYNSIKIYPTAANISISGSIEAPLVDLNGADNVLIDGRINANTNTSTINLTFSNKANSTLAETSTIRFVNSAENNTLSYLTITGTTANTSIYAANIYFSSSISGNGNDNNTIDHCNLTGVSSTLRPFAVIATSGGTASIYDNGNIISNNNFYDFSTNNSYARGGVYLSGYSTNFKILNNSFYESQTVVPNLSNNIFYGIYVNSPSNNVYHTIQGNYFGGTTPLATGNAMTFTPASSLGYLVYPIYVKTAATTSPVSIQGNIIKNIVINNVATLTPFMGISVWSGMANIGTSAGNIIGSGIGSGSIVVNVSSTYNNTGNSIHGIYAASANAVNISNNTIGSISTDGSNITGIYTSSTYGTMNITNNLIGSIDDATSYSISLQNTGLASSRSICGICVFGYSQNTINNNVISKIVHNNQTATTNSIFGILTRNGTPSITNNTIRDLTNNSNTSTYLSYSPSNGSYNVLESGPAITGIYTYPSNNLVTINISNNKLYNFYRPVVQSLTSYIRGISFYSNINNTLNINSNFINNFVNGPSNTGGTIFGIGQYAGNGLISLINNVISLGGNFPASSIYAAYFSSSDGNKLNAFYNTFNVYGYSNLPTSNDYALYAVNPAGSLKNIQNNLFINTRTNASTSSSVFHYGIYLNDNTPQNSLKLNNNNYYLGMGLGRTLGFNSYSINSLPLIYGLDANSQSINPNFSNPIGTSPYEYKTGALLNGVTVAATNVDYTGTTRGNIPNMGAFDKLAIPQTITFNALATKTFGDPSFMLTATGGNSGNPVTFTSADPTIATCTGTNGSIITILKAGTVSITANQIGNPVYAAATPVSQNLVINKANQTISLAPLPIGNVSLKDFAGTIPVIATASSGLSVTVSLSNTSAASLNTNNELYNIGSSGTVSINLFQAGNANYNPAVASYRFDVVKANQAITFNNIADRTYAGSPITINTSGLASSDAGLPISYSIQSGPATITSNTITITGAGVVKITASQAGDAQRNAAEAITQTINVLKGSQSITFSALASKSYGDAPFTISATGGSGSSPVTFSSSDPTIATCTGQNGSLVTILKAGTVSITASQMGDINYNDATSVAQNLVINKINQTLTLDPLPVNGMTLAEFGIPIQLSGTATSGLPIVFSLGNVTTAFINDESQLENVDRQGSIVITLTQDGDANYNPATVSYTFDVTKTNQTIYFDPLTDLTYSDGLTLTLGATTTSALGVSYEVLSGPATVANSTLTITGPGQVVIRASQAGNNIYNPAGNVIQTLTVNPKNNQSLYFNSIPDQVIRSGTFTFTITSTAGESGNPVTYTSSDPSIATISGTNTATVTVYKTGYVQITANQAANANYAAASMTQAFNITKPVLRITANNVTKNFGQTLTDNNTYTNFTATGLTGNETIGAVTVHYNNSGPANTLPDTYTSDIVISNATGGTFIPSNYDIIYVNGDVVVNGVVPTYLTYPTVSFSTGNLSTVTPSTDASLPYSSITISPALPSGLSLNTATGVISGTPAATSSNTYTVTLTNALGSISGTIFINVTSIPPAPVISFNNSSNTFTQGVAIADITPNIINPVSSFTISPSLPSGLNFNATTGVITGTASVTSTSAIYTITATNAGGSGTATISIQVVAPPPPAPVISYSDVFNIFTSGTTISAISPSLTGTANSWSISPNLPAGLNFNTTTGVITGTPTGTAASSFYTITATNDGGTGNTTIAIQVDAAVQTQSNPPAPVISYASNVNVFTVGTAISTISATVSGTVSSWSIAPTLPAGLTFNTNSGAITGTPTAAVSNTTHTITATNAGGSGTATITIQVNAAVQSPTNPPVTTPAPVISYASNVNVFTVGTTISTISATVSGTVSSWSIAPTLPAGLTFNTNSGAITGTPTAAVSNTTHTITATNAGGSGTATITIQVNAAVQSPTNPPVTTPAPVISYASNVNTFTVGTAISTISATVSGTVTSWSITPTLPTGLTFNTNSGAITGTPSAAVSNTTHTITATNAGGSGTATITIQVNAAVQSPTNPPVTTPAPVISYASNVNVFTVGTAISTISATVSGTVSSWSIAPTLPAGLTFNTNSGAITGTPTAAVSNTTHTITATNAGGSGTATITIQVNAAVQSPTNPPVTTPSPVISYASNVNVFTVGTTISTISATVSGTVSSWSIAPTLPGGLTFNTNSGAITGTPTAAVSNTTHTVTATNAGGSGTATITIQVNAAVQSPTNPPVVIPEVKPITGINLICGKNNTTQLSDLTIGGYWSSNKPSVALVSNTGLVTGIGNQNDTLTIVYTITVNGVSNAAYYTIKYVATPTVGITMNPIDLIANTPTRINARSFGVAYEWSSNSVNAYSLNSINLASPIATISAPVDFKIKITDINGCITLDTLPTRIFTEKKVYLPNTFTPNGDGINDDFKLNPVGIKQLIYFAVYNTRGIKLFETNNINDSWNGYYNGVLQPMASYPWVLSAIDENGKSINQTGTITLLR